MNLENELELKIRKATTNDNLQEIAELIYCTDQYIYPYWFESLEKCVEELPSLMVLENFLNLL